MPRIPDGVDWEPDYDDKPDPSDYEDDSGPGGHNCRYFYCETCKKDLRSTWVDEGIGFYEFWGATGTHHDWSEVCPECENPVDDDCFESKEAYDEYQLELKAEEEANEN